MPRNFIDVFKSIENQIDYFNNLKKNCYDRSRDTESHIQNLKKDKRYALCAVKLAELANFTVVRNNFSFSKKVVIKAVTKKEADEIAEKFNAMAQPLIGDRTTARVIRGPSNSYTVEIPLDKQLGEILKAGQQPQTSSSAVKSQFFRPVAPTEQAPIPSSEGNIFRVDSNLAVFEGLRLAKSDVGDDQGEDEEPDQRGDAPFHGGR